MSDEPSLSMSGLLDSEDEEMFDVEKPTPDRKKRPRLVLSDEEPPVVSPPPSKRLKTKSDADARRERLSALFDDVSIDESSDKGPDGAANPSVRSIDEQDEFATDTTHVDAVPEPPRLVNETVGARCTFAWEGQTTDTWFLVQDGDNGEYVTEPSVDWTVLVLGENAERFGAPSGCNYVIGVGASARLITSPLIEYTLVLSSCDKRFDFRLDADSAGTAMPPVVHIDRVRNMRPILEPAATYYSELLTHLCDTLYAHTETCTDKSMLPGCVREALRSVKQFDLLANAAAKLKPPKRVPLNSLSSRSDRKGALKERLSVPCIYAFKRRVNVSTKNASKCRVFVEDMHASKLFCKTLPLAGFDAYTSLRGELLDAGVSDELAFSRPPVFASTPDIGSHFTALRDALLVPSGDPLTVAAIAPLSLDWVEDYFHWRQNQPSVSDADDTSRTVITLESLRNIFTFSEVWFDYVKKVQNYGALIVYPLRRAMKERYLEHHGLDTKREEDRIAYFGHVTDLTTYIHRQLNQLRKDPAASVRKHVNTTTAPIPVPDASEAHFRLYAPVAARGFPMIANAVAQLARRWGEHVQQHKLPFSYQTQAPVSVLDVSPSASMRCQVEEIIDKIRTHRLADESNTKSVVVVQPGCNMQDALGLKTESRPLLLVVRDGHRLALDDWMQLARILTEKRAFFASLTHMLVLVSKHTLRVEGGASIIESLTRIGRALDSRLGASASRVSRDGALATKPWWKYYRSPGLRSSELYPTTEREEQLEFHTKRMAFIKDPRAYANQVHLGKILRTMFSRHAPHFSTDRVLVLSAFKKTRMLLEAAIHVAGRANTGSVDFATFYEFEKNPGRFTYYAMVVVGDLDNERAWSQVTYGHINACLERCTKKMLVLGTRELFQERFLASTSKTDALERTDQITIVHDNFNRWLTTPRGESFFPSHA